MTTQAPPKASTIRWSNEQQDLAVEALRQVVRRIREGAATDELAESRSARRGVAARVEELMLALAADGGTVELPIARRKEAEVEG